MSVRIITGTWDDSAPHLTKETKDELYAAIPPYLRDARTRGIPVLGSGLIYPVPEDDIKVPDRPIPDDWPRGYAMDVGWNRTAVGWFAKNPETGVLFCYDYHYQGGELPAIHAEAIRARGAWMWGVIDPRSDSRSQIDGQQLFGMYTKPISQGGYGLNLIKADNSVTTGIVEVWKRLVGGMLKVFASVQPFWEEIRIYRRESNENETGKIVKKNDHFMDLCLAGETMVVTDRGSVPITELVGTSGKVLGPSGWNDYSNCRRYHANSPVVRVEFSDGRSIICTPDHKFLTAYGWIEARELSGLDCCDIIAQCNRLKSPQPARNFKEFATTFAENIFNAMVCGSIGRYGNLRTEGQFQRALMFTTGTKTEKIINRGTSSLSPAQSIAACTKRAITDRQLYRLARLQLSGTNPRLDSRGIERILRRFPAMFYTSNASSHANSAEKNSRPQIKGPIDFAQTIAGRPGEEDSTSIPRGESANSARSHTWPRANISSHPIVPENASGVRVKRISDAGLSDSYCLTAHQDNSFAVENGIVVQNCRYFIMSGIDRMETGPKPSNITSFHTSLLGPRMGYQNSGTWMGG